VDASPYVRSDPVHAAASITGMNGFGAVAPVERHRRLAGDCHTARRRPARAVPFTGTSIAATRKWPRAGERQVPVVSPTPARHRGGAPRARHHEE